MAKEAHYRFEMKTFSRGKTDLSIVAKAAYRSGSRLRDDLTGQVYDYKARSQEVLSSVILAPDNAPEWMRNGESLWNGVEAVSTRSNARMAREIMPSLPVQLSEEQQKEMLHGWVQKELVSRGMVAHVSIHRSKDGNNPHAHILCSTREISGEGFGKVVREWNDVALLKSFRESYAVAENAALEKAGREERVDHRSLADRGVDRIPEPKIGVSATAMERKGIATDRGKLSMWAKIDNLVRYAVRGIERGGEVPQVGAGQTWWERAQVAIDWTTGQVGEIIRDESSGAGRRNVAAFEPPEPSPSSYWVDRIAAERDQNNRERSEPEMGFG